MNYSKISTFLLREKAFAILGLRRKKKSMLEIFIVWEGGVFLFWLGFVVVAGLFWFFLKDENPQISFC